MTDRKHQHTFHTVGFVWLIYCARVWTTLAEFGWAGHEREIFPPLLYHHKPNLLGVPSGLMLLTLRKQVAHGHHVTLLFKTLLASSLNRISFSSLRFLPSLIHLCLQPSAHCSYWYMPAFPARVYTPWKKPIHSPTLTVYLHAELHMGEYIVEEDISLFSRSTIPTTVCVLPWEVITSISEIKF